MRNQFLLHVKSLKTPLFLLTFLSLFYQVGHAQVSSYGFAQNSGTYTPITGGNVLFTGSFDDDNPMAVTIPTFIFNGVAYNTLYVDPNGFAGFTGTPWFGGDSYTPLSSSIVADGLISPFGRDLTNSDVGNPEISWLQVGSEIVVQWQDMKRYTSTTNTEQFSFQARLDTATGVIRFVYDAVNGTSAVTNNPQVGLRGVDNTFPGNVNARQVLAGGSWTATTAGTSNASTLVFTTGTTVPAAGQTYIFSAPACIAPTAVTISGITQTAANISWTGNASAAGYAWEVVASGAGAFSTPIAGNYTVAPTTTASTGSVLAPNTQYDVYVKTGCSATNLSDTSTWSTVASFRTPCATITTLPYLESFDAGTLNSCWTASAGSGYSYLWDVTAADATHGAAGPEAGAGFAFLNVYNGQTAYNPYNLTSPSFTLPAAPQQVSYYYFLGANGYTGTSPYPLALQVSTDGGVTWTDIYDHSTANSTFASSNAVSNWHLNTVSLAAYANQTIQLRFASNSNYGSNFTNQGIDEFAITAIPSCSPPTGLTVSNITPTSADFSWTAPATGTPVGYGWEVVATGAGSGGTVVAGNIVTGVTTASSGSTLAANTTYDLYVKTGCSATNLADTSTWAGPVTFTTLCSNVTLPLVQGFNSTAIPSCWSQQYVTGTSSLQYVATSSFPTTTPQEGTDYVYWNSYNIGNNNETRLVSPPITTTGAPSVDVSFYFYNENNTSYSTGQYLTEGVTVQYSLNGTTWTDVQFFPRHDSTFAAGTGAWKQKILLLPAAAGNQATVYVGFKFHSGFGDNVSFDNLNIFATPACTGVATALSSSAITTSGFTASWTAASPAPVNGYVWEAVLSGAGSGGTPVASGTVAAGVTTVAVSGLSASTSYDFYVRGDCGSLSLGPWSAVLSVTTSCGNTTLPIIQGFNSASIPACWTQQYVVGTDDLQYLTTSGNPITAPQEGSNFVEWDAYNYTGGDETRLVSPPITTTGTASVDVSFYWYNENSTFYNTGNYLNEGATLQYSPDGIAWTDVQFYPRQDATLASGTEQWNQKVITLPAAVGNQGTVYVGVKFHSEFGDNVSFDNLHIYATPACAALPTALTATNATTTGFTLSWTAASPAPAVGYNWEVVAAGAGSAGTPVASGSTAAAVTTAAVSGLSANTSYDVYVQSDCGGGSGTSLWAGPITVTTPCGTSTLPLVQGFNSTTIPACWTQQYVVGTSNLQYVATSGNPATTPQEGSDYVYWNSFSITSGNETRLVSPPLVTTGTPSVDISFYFYNENGFNYNTGNFLNEGVTVQYSTNGTTWTDVQFFARQDSSLTQGTGAWKQKLLTLPAAVGNQATVYVGFKFHSVFGDNVSFDNLHIYSTPSCAGAPTAIVSSNVTATGGTVSWAAASPVPANGYDWVLVASGAGPAGTPVASGTSTTTADSASFTGLSANTTYDFYVQSDCGGGSTGVWAGPLSITTPCGSINLPLIQGFNSTTIPACWTQASIVGTSVLQFVAASGQPTTTPQEGTDYVYWNSYSITSGNEARLISPPIVTSGTPSVDISFYWYNENSQFYNTGTYLNEGVTVQYSLNGTTWTDVQFYPRQDFSYAVAQGGWKKKYLTLPAAVANQANVYIGFKFHSSFGDNCSFDNLNIFASPPCAGYPDSLAVSSITSATATATWTPGTPAPANGYNWELVATGAGPTGTALASGTSLVDTAFITGLSPNTTYDLYVQSNCGGVLGVGVWSGPATFHTPCLNTALPLIEGFNGTSIPACWTQQYVTGSTDLQYVATSNFPTTVPQEGTDFVLWQSSNTNTDTRLVSPPITTTGTSSVDVQFYWFNENSTFANSNNFLLEGATAQYSLDGVTWTDVQFFPRQDNGLASGTGAWKKKTITLPLAAGNQSTIYVGFQFHGEFGENSSLDNINIFPSLPCAGGPSALAVTNVTTTTATLSWTAAPSTPAGGYNWVVVAAGDSATGTAIASGSTAAGVTTASISGLTANTPYDVYVQSNCGGGNGVGYWVGPLSFSTPCTAITTLPWTEGFEGLGTVGTDILPPCWLGVPSTRWTSANAPLGFSNIGARGGTHYIYDRYNANDTIFTPSFTLTGGTQYEFYFYYQTDGRTGWDSLYTMYGTSQTQNGMTNLIGTPVLGPTNTGYVKYSAIFTPAASGTYFFGVKLGATFNPNDIAFDDFGLQVVVPCPNPPLGGVIQGPASVCANTQIHLSLTGYSPYTTLQWQVSLDTINFTDIPSANNDVFTDFITNAQYYRVKVKCADSSYSAIFAVHLNSPTQCYCTSGLGGFCGGNDIDTASIAGTNFFVNYTTCNTTVNGDAYTVFPQLGDSTTTLQRGGSYPLFLHMTGISISSAWIDTNQNGVFEPNEWVQVTTAATNGTATFNIANYTKLGTTGFRIRSRNQGNNNGAIDACSPFGSGETFDFLITIVDSNCTHTPTVIDTVSNVTCHGGNNGSISLALSGGLSPFTHTWSSGTSGLSITNLTAGNYTDTISFYNGCKYLYGPVAVSEPAALSAVTDSITEVGCLGASTGTVYITVSGGTPGYTNHWSNGTSAFILPGVPAGIYRDTVTDAHGCTLVVGPDTVTQPASAVAVVIDSTHAAKCNGSSNGAIYTTASGGTGPYTYLWDNAAASTTDDITGLPSRTYNLMVMDHNGCMVMISDSVSQPGVLNVHTDSVVNTKCHTSSDGSIYVSVTGGTIPYVYAWTGGANTLDLFFKAAGAYTLTVTDHNGCTAGATDTIKSPGAISISSNITNQIQNGALGSIALTAAGGTAPYKYHWNTGDSTSSLSNLVAGIYLVTVTDHNGCTAAQRDTVNLVVTSITEVNGDIKNFNIYPNPSSAVFNVVVELSHTIPVKLEVYSITGQAIPVSPIENPLNNSYQIDLGNQAEGIYFVKITAGDNTMVRKITVVR